MSHHFLLILLVKYLYVLDLYHLHGDVTKQNNMPLNVNVHIFSAIKTG